MDILRQFPLAEMGTESRVSRPKKIQKQALFYRYFLCAYHFVAFVDVDEIQSAGLVADIDWRLAVAKGLGVNGLPYGVA